MKLVARIIVAVVANAAGIAAAGTWIPGFVVAPGYETLLTIAGILTLLNFFMKPLLRLVLAPVIIITLGLGLIVVNAVVLYVLDFLSDGLTIEAIPAYLLGGLLIGIINFVFHIARAK